jgi:hypothetical protein
MLKIRVRDFHDLECMPWGKSQEFWVSWRNKNFPENSRNPLLWTQFGVDLAFGMLQQHVKSRLKFEEIMQHSFFLPEKHLLGGNIEKENIPMNL